MDKFGLFDILNKLQSNNKQSDILSNLLTNFLSKQSSNPPAEKNKKGVDSKITEPPPYYKSDAILNVIKKHDILSKQIDKDNKNH